MVACRIPALIRDGGRGHAKQAKNQGPGVGGNERTLMFPLATAYFMRRNFIFCLPCRFCSTFDQDFFNAFVLFAGGLFFEGAAFGDAPCSLLAPDERV